VAVLALGLIVCSSAALRADDKADDKKSNADKIVGTWKLVKTPRGAVPPGLSVLATFDKDGKVTVKSSFMDKNDSKSGTYKVDGKKLTIKLEGEKEETETIKTLDDKELVTVDAKGKESGFKKAAKD
jgi:uncharacterized protein (TIGR03066 family)